MFLLEGQGDAEADGAAAGFVGAAVGRLHDAGTGAGADQEALPLRELERPLRHLEGQLAAGLVIGGAAQVDLGHPQAVGAFGAVALAAGGHGLGFLEALAGDVGGEGARRAEHHDRVADVVFLEPYVRLGHLGQDADAPGLGADHELRVEVGLGRGGPQFAFFWGHQAILPRRRAPASREAWGLTPLGASPWLSPLTPCIRPTVRLRSPAPASAVSAPVPRPPVAVRSWPSAAPSAASASALPKPHASPAGASNSRLGRVQPPPPRRLATRLRAFSFELPAVGCPWSGPVRRDRRQEEPAFGRRP